MKTHGKEQQSLYIGLIISFVLVMPVRAITPARGGLYATIQQGIRANLFKDIFNISGMANNLHAKESLTIFVPRDSRCDESQKKTLAAVHDQATARRFVLDHIIKGQIGISTDQGRALAVNYYPDLSSPSFEHTTIHPGEVLKVKTLSGKDLEIRVSAGSVHIGSKAIILENMMYGDPGPGAHDEPAWSMAELDSCGLL